MRDMIPHMELHQPADVEGALELMDRYGEEGWALAGGYDSLGWLKNRTKRPTALIDLEGLDALKGVREWGGGLEIGALTTLTEVERSSLVGERFGILADAARQVASPQIRNAGTIGGNLCQDARCWYYRSGLPCYRAGGNVCYADTPEGMNREHALFGADRCVAVTPSDTAPALVALEAEMVVRRRGGRERLIPAPEFFMGPGVDITRMTVLEPGDLLTTIRIPERWAGARFRFEKVADRGSWDFALVSLASAMRVEAGTIRDCRLVAGAVQCVPRRLTRAERILRGSAPSEELAGRAASAASRGARTLNYNHFKVPLLENLVKRAVRDAATG